MGWFKVNFLGLMGQMRWSYLPPLMVYFAAGVSGFTSIIESFFVKENLGLNPTFLASIGFWAGLPWALKMPLGHLVDLFWQRKAVFVYVGAALMAASLLIMVGLTGYANWMATMLPVEIWYIISMLLAPVGFVLQDVVADAMTVEAVPTHQNDGSPIPENRLRQMHVTMQTLGRIAIVGGGALVAGAGGWLARAVSYEVMYWISLIIPAISVMGVSLGAWMQRQRRQYLAPDGLGTDPQPDLLSCPEHKGESQPAYPGRQRGVCYPVLYVGALRHSPERRNHFSVLHERYSLFDATASSGFRSGQTS